MWFAFALAACVAALLVAEYRGSRTGVWVAKPAAAACFVAAALSFGALDSSYGRFVLAGLALSLCGDVLLIPDERPRAFRAGMASFGLAHVAFAVAFSLRFASAALAALAAIAAGLAAWRILRWLRPHLPPDMRGPVRAYLAVIAAMLVCAAGAAPASVWIIVGAAMFGASDLAVARERFVARSFANGAWGLPLYFAAQLVLASTVL